METTCARLDSIQVTDLRILLGWDGIRESPDPHGLALEFVRPAFRHACAVFGWDPAFAATAEGVPPPIR